MTHAPWCCKHKKTLAYLCAVATAELALHVLQIVEVL